MAAIALACLVCSCACVGSAAGAGITRTTLSNGLRVVLAPDSLATAADVAVWYATGARHEQPGQPGMSRLFERLMFRGSAHVPGGEHRRRIHAEGGVSNTTTTPDYSCFWETVPGEAVGMALQLEADRMAGLRVSAAALDEERRAVDEDRRMATQRTPVSRGLAQLYAAVFGNRSYGRPSLGVEGGLARVSIREVEAWRRERYTPANAVLTVVGRFDPATTLQRIRQWFEPIPRGSAPTASKPGSPAVGTRRVDRVDAQARLLFVGWRGPGATDVDAAAFEVLARVLGSGEQARLPRSLVAESKMAVAAQAGCNVHQDASLLWTLAVINTQVDSTTAERLLFDEVTRLTNEPLTEEEMNAARAALESSSWFTQQSARGRAVALGEAELLMGDANRSTARAEALARLNPADVQRVARKFLTDAGRGIVWLVPTVGSGAGGAR